MEMGTGFACWLLLCICFLGLNRSAPTLEILGVFIKPQHYSIWKEWKVFLQCSFVEKIIRKLCIFSLFRPWTRHLHNKGNSAIFTFPLKISECTFIHQLCLHFYCWRRTLWNFLHKKLHKWILFTFLVISVNFWVFHFSKRIWNFLAFNRKETPSAFFTYKFFCNL